VPEVGDYHALTQEELEGRVLVRYCPSGIEVMSNVCRHRQAIMLKGRGNTGNGTWSAPCIGGPTTPLVQGPS
jgi:choline monooxygenase